MVSSMWDDVHILYGCLPKFPAAQFTKSTSSLSAT